MRFDSFAHMLSHWADTAPDAPAVRHANGVCTFSELKALAERRAEELRRTGKTCLGLLSDGSFECVIELFAANLAGLQLVMLDEDAPDDLLKMLIGYTDIDLLWSADDELTEELSPALTGGVQNGRDRILFFTSGTTERSKAVVLTGHSLCQSAYNGAAKLPLSPDDTLLCMLPLGHVFGFVCGLMWGLSCGACVALGRGARHYMDDCVFFKPTAVSVVPMLLGFLLKMNCVNPELKLILVGAGDCAPQLLQAAAAKGIRVSFGYGLTETSSGVAISVSGDPFAMEVCPDDTITLAEDGEILIQAPTCVMQGYYKMPEATEAVLKDGVLYTGDLGRFDDEGKLHITGRKKDMLVLPDGTKMFLPELEGRIAQAVSNPEIAVTLRASRPVLVYSGAGEKDEILSQLKPLLRELPRGQQITDVIVTDAPLLRTATGKLKRWELDAMLNRQQ